MRTIIAGSRTITDMQLVVKAIQQAPFTITEIISGGAKGVDTLAQEYAKINGIPFHLFEADWAQYGRRAGFIRNEDMAIEAEALIAIWDECSSGTRHMISIALRYKLQIHVLKESQ